MGSRARMNDYGARMLRTYSCRPKVRYERYYHFGLDRTVANFEVPPLGRAVRITNLSGEPIILTRRRVQGGNFR